MDIEFSTVSFVSALIVLIPLPWHWRTRNICTSSIMLWLAASNIYRGINIILWADNGDVKYKIWCDIVVRVHISSGIGVPASVMCICRRLARAASPFCKAPNPCEKLQRMRSEIGMCVVLPIIVMTLHLIVQPSRFAITEGYGCSATYYPYILSFFIIHIPPVFLSWVGALYAGIALRWLIHRRIQFQRASSPAQPPPVSGRYLRFVALAIILMTFATTWTSWDKVHKYWHTIALVSRDEFPELDSTGFKVDWYFIPIASVTVFAQFGFDDRVIPEYKSMFAWIKARVFSTKPAKVVVLPLRVNDAMLAEIGSETAATVTDEARSDDVLLPSFPVANALA